MNFRPKKERKLAWRPNFCDTSKLPDTSVVRKNFLFNALGVLVALLAIGYLIPLELSYRDAVSGIEDLENEYVENSKRNEQYIAQSEEFEKAVELVKDFNHFYKDSIDPLGLIIALSNNRYEDLTLTKISFKENEIVEQPKKAKKKEIYSEVKRNYVLMLDGYIPGSYDFALDKMNKYMAMVKELPEFSPVLKDIEMKSLVRDPEKQIFKYSIHVELDKNK